MRAVVLLILITCAAIAIHGYHFGAEDEAIYLPAIKQSLDSTLYPYDAIFFLSQTRWTLFDEGVAWLARASRLPLDVVVFALYAGGVGFLLSGCLAVGRRLFGRTEAQWGGVALVAAVMTIPIAGTLVLMVDSYLHPRILATAAALYALAAILDGKWRAVGWLAVAAAIHPIVTGYAALHLLFQVPVKLPKLSSRFEPAGAGASAMLFLQPQNGWTGVVPFRRHFFPLRWKWYEWLGAVGPVVLLLWFARLAASDANKPCERVCKRLALSASLGTLGGVALGLLPDPDQFAVIQPMRHLHLVYVLMFLIGGGFFAQHVLRSSPHRWALAFAPLCLGMFFVQVSLFGWSHIEWPGRSPQNDWVRAFLWIRDHTPRNAYFALDARYMAAPGEFNHGFRALAERSMMADEIKDRCLAEMFPSIARTWQMQSTATSNLTHFKRADFLLLRDEFGVNWAVLPARDDGGLRFRPGIRCPYRNDSVQVCRVE